MQTVRLGVAAALALAASQAAAFHSGGVADCDGCHVMHGKPDGSAATARLLLASDPSSVCLNCHSGTTPAPFSVLTVSPAGNSVPGNYTPGGDFGWLLRTWMWAGTAGTERSEGNRHGHNVIAADYGLLPDLRLATAPGGSYPSTSLSCISCHDPHGNYRITDIVGTVATTGLPIASSGSYGDTLKLPTSEAAVGVYRLLGGPGYAPRSIPPGLAFSYNPPVALAPTVFNQSEATSDVRVAYGYGTSEWCSNCHPNLHAGTTGFAHPAGNAAKLATLAATYNAYVKTGDMSGLQATSYTSIVPYEEGSTDLVALSTRARSDGGALTGPFTGQENVMCLSCHRAHASGWDGATRWNTVHVDRTNGWIVAGGQWPGIDATDPAAVDPLVAQGRTTTETRAAMYDRDPLRFASFQRSLCNKCHGQDAPAPAAPPDPTVLTVPTLP